VARYRVTVVDPSGRIGPGVAWKPYRSDSLLEYGAEIVVESESADPGQVRARVTDVDNDAFFTNKVTVQAIHES
jgi:hypothetical protein